MTGRFWLIKIGNAKGYANLVANISICLAILSDQSVVCSIFTSPFGIGSAWNLDGVGTKNSTRYQICPVGKKKTKKAVGNTDPEL